jgi:proteasome lid subunit RPN8/RPN11
MKKIIFEEGLRKKIVSHADSYKSGEVCGIISGKRSEVESIVKSVFPCKNVSKIPGGTYEIDPSEVLKTLVEIDGKGEEHLGFYHSHPFSSALPSGIDEMDAEHWGGHDFVIYSTTAGHMRGFEWIGEDKKFVEAEIDGEIIVEEDWEKLGSFEIPYQIDFIIENEEVPLGRRNFIMRKGKVVLIGMPEELKPKAPNKYVTIEWFDDGSVVRNTITRKEFEKKARMEMAW